MRSEDLVPTADHIEICQLGWIDASNDDDETRRKHVEKMRNSAGVAEWNAGQLDVYVLGYVTFVYAYTNAMKVEIE